MCESPFEFASYGRFGCRADCGRLSESVENLTTIQVDLHFNFDHPVGSIPATELMSQAQWNLCPENGAPHGRDCYYEEDRIFDRIEGTIQEVIDDVPDGLWTIKVKRDFFHKVQGAVRVRDLVEEQARQYTKIWIAMEAANASHTYEEGVLTVCIPQDSLRAGTSDMLQIPQSPVSPVSGGIMCGRSKREIPTVTAMYAGHNQSCQNTLVRPCEPDTHTGGGG